MNPAILSEIAGESVPVETIDTSISLAVIDKSVISPTIKKTFSDYFSEDTIKLLVIFNTIYILGHILGEW